VDDFFTFVSHFVHTQCILARTAKEWENYPVIQSWRFAHSSALIAGLLTLSTESASCQEWNTYKPSLRSQMAQLDRAKAASLLSTFCVSLTDTEHGLTCKTGRLGPAFADIGGNEFQPQSVIFGRFLDSTAENAVISGSSHESHPDHWGGTLLLTRGDGNWKPVWYKSALITRSCEKAERPDGREILICEWEDGGMGHRIHILDAIDLRHASADTPPLAVADSFDSDFCTGQQQRMDAIHFGIDRRSFSTVLRTPEWEVIPEGHCGPQRPKRPKLSVRMEFEITNEGIRSR
jgi:hypothetical protein